jgi:hypothetical protein
MVASVNGKFTNTSAHTSYLILLKNNGRHPAGQRGSVSPPFTSPTRAKPRRNRFGLPRWSIRFQNLHPAKGGAAYYSGQPNHRQRSSGRYCLKDPARRCRRLMEQPDRARIIGGRIGTSSTIFKSSQNDRFRTRACRRQAALRAAQALTPANSNCRCRRSRICSSMRSAHAPGETRRARLAAGSMPSAGPGACLASW